MDVCRASSAARTRRARRPTSLWITNGLVQLFLIVAFFANSTYQALFYIASTAILVPYVFSGAYAAKLAITGEAYREGESRTRDLVVGLIATVYGIWLVYAAGPTYLFMAAMLYAPGIVILRHRPPRGRREELYSRWRSLIAVGFVDRRLAAAYDLDGRISPL